VVLLWIFYVKLKDKTLKFVYAHKLRHK